MSEVLANGVTGGMSHPTLLPIRSGAIIMKGPDNDDPRIPPIDGSGKIEHCGPGGSQTAMNWTLWGPSSLQQSKRLALDECERRPNKRKNFRPRNIRVAELPECDSDQEINDHFRRTLLPQKPLERSNDSDPVDLSIKNGIENHSDDESCVSSPSQWMDTNEWLNNDSNDENQNKHGANSDYDQYVNENCPKSGMSDLLNTYGLQRHEISQISESHNREEDSRCSSPSPSQPPTPPETPKDVSFQPNYRDAAPPVLNSENTLAALHAHMQSVLKSVGAPRSPSPTSSLSNSEASDFHKRPGSHNPLNSTSSNGSDMLAYLQSLSMSTTFHSSNHFRSELSNSNQQIREAPVRSSLGVPESTKPSISSQTSVGSSIGNRIGSSTNKQNGPVDYTRYVKRFSSALDCGNSHCKDLNYREHFHCVDCNPRVFVKKEEMIRHFKWHKKRDESLQHGFMRYSPMDDCSDMFSQCTHNRKQTHYHCLKARLLIACYFG